jgi:hypothetical protein
MPFNRIAENKIREAIAEGKFDNLPGAGTPLDFDEYFSTPEELRMAYSILKNANCAPAEVELLKEIARLTEALAAADDEATEALRRTLVDRQTELAILFERRPGQQRPPRL